MKGKIDNNGWLRIERGSKEKLQECPFMQRAFEVNDIVIAPCGDWCPLFEEPEPEFGTKSVILRICKDKILFFDEFTDEKEDV